LKSTVSPYAFELKASLLTLILAACFGIHSFGITDPLNLRRACKAANDSDIVLKWNIPNDGCNSFISYDIYARKDLSSSFTLIDSVKSYSQLQYTHKGAFLQANSWQYFVIVRNDCTGSPTLSSDTLNIDLTQPIDQYIDSVSVDPVSGKYIIGWKTNTSLDLAGYKIYEVIGSNNIEITDLSNTTNQFTDISSDPQSNNKIYSIAAYDSCNNITAIIDRHRAIKLSVSFDSCSKVFSLSWSPYIGMNILKYRVLSNINNNGFNKVKDISSTSSSYNFSSVGLNDGDQVCFEIRGFKSTDTLVSTTSNQICLTANFADTSTINYISSVSVADPFHITVDWITDNSDLISLIVLKQSTDGLNFSSRRIFKPLSNTLHFILDSVNTDSIQYYYKILVYNSCGQFQGTSNVSNTILVKANKIIAGSNQVEWNFYSQFNAGVLKYDIYHGTGDVFLGYTFNFAGSVDSAKHTYIDNNLPSDIANDGVCYYIKATENSGNIYGINGAESKSNQVCIAGDMLVFYPNVFKPNSKIDQNISFKPRGIFIDYKRSSLSIYDRWGNLVYDMVDLTHGWDGNDKSGSPYNDDTFAFFSIVYPIKGKPQEFKGLVHLER
jgi:gliding motility-associated-like protein